MKSKEEKFEEKVLSVIKELESRGMRVKIEFSNGDVYHTTEVINK